MIPLRSAALTCLLLLPLSLSAANTLSPGDLRCESRTNPLGIDEAAPRLSWILSSPGRGERQTAYRVQVASTSEKLRSGVGDLWDSKRVQSEETLGVEYGGSCLKSHQRCFWRVQVWDRDGTPSNWSEPAEWTMGIFSASEWKAGWITHPDTSLRSGPLPVFRKERAISRPLRRALLSVAGLGMHEVRINGRRVGENVLGPAWTNYRESVLYETHDVTSLLQTGTNAIGVLLGNGFYNVAGGRYAKYTASFSSPKLILNLHLEYQDGSTEDVGTDGTWRTAAGPVVFSCIYGGEDYDARKEQDGWDKPGFDDSSWQPARGSEPATPVLRSQSSPPIRVTQTFRPVRVTQPKPGVSVYDLGQNLSGWPRVAVSGAEGATVKLIPGELLTADGLVNQRSSGSPVWFSYTLRGKGREEWSPRFSYYGFRYVQVEGPVKIEELTGEFVHASAARAGQFRCSNELFNRIHLLIDAAVRSNLQHVLTDCPHREKLGWLEVAHLMGPSLLYNWDLRTLFPKIARDMREAQTRDGLVPDIAPEYVLFKDGFRDSPEWGSAAVFVPWLAYDWYGDRSILRDNYAAMARYVDYLTERAEGGILSHGLGDWYDIAPGPPGRSKLTPKGVTATAIYFADLRALGGIAALLGRDSESRAYSKRADAVRAAFEKTFWNAAKGHYGSDSQTSNAMPLVLDIAPAGRRAALAERLAEDVRRHGNHPTAGDVGHRYLVRALTDADRGDVLFDMTAQTEAPSYGAQLAQGATSLTEAWDGNPNSSQNHCMLGHIEEWFYAGLAGIRQDPAAPAFRKVVIRPQVVGDVRWVEGRYESVRGPIASLWRIENGTLTLRVSIPPGVTAEVWMPAASASEVQAAPGAKLLRQAPGAAVLAVESGEYAFSARAR